MTSLSGPTPLSDNAEEVITRRLDVSEKPVELSSDTDLIDAYEIDNSVEQIIERDFKEIALQFPDELLHLSARIAALLFARTKRNVFVLADTAYGSCCVDTVAAQHVNADVVIHYGRTCLSPTTGIPVIYVFGREKIDTLHAVESLCSAALTTKKVLLMYDVVYYHASEDVAKKLEDKGLLVCRSIIDPTINLHKEQSSLAPSSLQSTSDNIPLPRDLEDITNDTGIVYPPPLRALDDIKPKRSGRYYDLPSGSISDYDIFYIGGETLALKNIIMTHPHNKTFTYDPTTRIARLEDLQVNRLLMRRYVLVQKAKDANIIGIVVGTLGVANYLSVIDRLKAMIKKAGRKSYVFSVGKLNPSKMANFMEIECWVLVACEENSLVESKDFYKPIVTPWELEVALSKKEWDGSYVTDFQRVLDARDETDDNDSEDIPHYSLITGKLRSTTIHDQRSTSNATTQMDDGTIMLRNSTSTLATVNGTSMPSTQFLHSRQYQGLETDSNLEASQVEEGRSGIARGYTHSGTDTKR